MADPEPMEKSNIYIEKRPKDCRAASLVGEYLRYSSERYRRYRGLSIFIFILDTISDNQYLSGIFRYLA